MACADVGEETAAVVARLKLEAGDHLLIDVAEHQASAALDHVPGCVVEPSELQIGMLSFAEAE